MYLSASVFGGWCDGLANPERAGAVAGVGRQSWYGGGIRRYHSGAADPSGSATAAVHAEPATSARPGVSCCRWRSDPFKPIAVALGEFYISEYCHNDGQDGPDDADDDPAAAILFAAECYLHAEPAFAVHVAGRAIDAVDYRMELTRPIAWSTWWRITRLLLGRLDGQLAAFHDEEGPVKDAL